MVAEHLSEEILSGAIAPGARITESALAEKHSVSRATVREAFSIVERARLVVRIPRFGAQVVDVRLDVIQEISEVRGVLLALAVQRAISLADDSAVAAFRSLVAEIKQLAESDSVTAEEFAACTAVAQRRLLEMARNRTLTEFYEELSNVSLWNAVVRSRSTAYSTVERRRQSARHWASLSEAIEARDVARGNDAARAMLADVARFMESVLKPQDGAPNGVAKI